MSRIEMSRAIAFTLTIFASIVAAEIRSESIVLDDSRAAWRHEEAQLCSLANGGTFYHSGSADIEKFLSYTFDVEKDGCYLIEQYHPALPEGGCGSDFVPGIVPVRIDYCRGETAWTTLNQAASGGDWTKIGRLPFYVNEGDYTISLRRSTLPSLTKADGVGERWMSTSFRLTWLADTCHKHDRDEARKSSPPKPTPRESLEEEAEQQTVDSTEAVQVSLADAGSEVQMPVVAAAFQLLLNEPRDDGAFSKFFFRAPVDGCYVVEERHPHIPGATREPFTVNYCKGLSAVGSLDHTDGRHNQWNFVAALPFFDDLDGSVILPKGLVARGGDRHQLRVTHVGASCIARRAQVYQAELRIQTDFSHVQDRLGEFKSSLMNVLKTEWLQPAQVHSSRVAITQLRAGSIVAGLSVLPTAHSPSLLGPDSLTALASLQDSLASSALQARICSVAGSASSTCRVSLESVGRAKPLVYDNGRATGRNSDADENNDINIIVIVSIAVGVLVTIACGALSYKLCLQRKPNTKAIASPEGEVHIAKDIIIVKKDVETQWEDGSTLTPDCEAANLEDVRSAGSAGENEGNV